MAAANVFVVTAANFQKEVVERSLTRPVLLDFWAAWCGPCRALTPVLEKLAAEFGGAFLLGKVDTEAEQDLAYAFQVQSIPFCVLIDGGRPIDGFTGALGEVELRRFLQRHGVTPMTAEAPEEQATPVDPNSPEQRLQRAFAHAAAGRAPQALAELEGFPEEDERFERSERLRQGIEFLQANLDPARGGAEAALAAARAMFVRGDVEGAMARILEATAQQKDFRQGLLRKAMLLCFLVLGEDDERCDDYRRRFATLMY